MTAAQDERVLVTGATGMVGSAVLEQLLGAGYTRVRALRRSGRGGAAQGSPWVEWIEGDVLDVLGLEGAMQGVSTVFHCAGSIHSRQRDKRQMWRINAEGTANVVNAALAAGVRRIVHTGSVATLMRTDSAPIDEYADWEPGARAGSYAESKYRAEMEVWRGMAEGLEAVVVLPAYVLAAGFWDRGAMQLFERVYRGLAFYPRGSAGFVDVRDLALFMVRAARVAPSGSRYVLCAESWSWHKLLTFIAEALGVSPPSAPLPRWAEPLVVSWSWLHSRLTGKEHLFTTDRMRQLRTCYRYDASRAASLDGFHFRPLCETIRQLAAAFLAQQE